MISVVIPCYNSEEYIGRALESVFAQTFTDFEIIVVDNGSTDNTESLVEGYNRKYPEKIRLVKESKKGAPSARNKGLSEARGEWLQFLDSDDELLPNKLEEQIKVANRFPVDLVIGHCWIHSYEKSTPTEHQVESENVWKGLVLSKLGRTSSNLWRRKAVLNVGGWDETKTSSQEYNLLFKLLQQKEVAGFCLQPLTHIYMRENSLHKSTNKERIAEVLENNIRLRLDVKQYLMANNKLTKHLDETINIYIHQYLMSYKGIVPFYVNQKLKELKLELPLMYLVKRNLRRAGYQLRYYRKRVANLGR